MISILPLSQYVITNRTIYCFIFNPPNADDELTRTESEVCGSVDKILTVCVFITRLKFRSFPSSLCNFHSIPRLLNTLKWLANLPCRVRTDGCAPLPLVEAENIPTLSFHQTIFPHHNSAILDMYTSHVICSLFHKCPKGLFSYFLLDPSDFRTCFLDADWPVARAS